MFHHKCGHDLTITLTWSTVKISTVNFVHYVSPYVTYTLCSFGCLFKQKTFGLCGQIKAMCLLDYYWSCYAFITIKGNAKDFLPHLYFSFFKELRFLLTLMWASQSYCRIMWWMFKMNRKIFMFRFCR